MIDSLHNLEPVQPLSSITLTKVYLELIRTSMIVQLLISNASWKILPILIN